MLNECCGLEDRHSVGCAYENQFLQWHKPGVKYEPLIKILAVSSRESWILCTKTEKVLAKIFHSGYGTYHWEIRQVAP